MGWDHWSHFLPSQPNHSLLKSVLLSITVNWLMSRCLHLETWSRNHVNLTRLSMDGSPREIPLLRCRESPDSRWELIGQRPWCDWQPLQLQECDVACNALFPRWIRHVSSSNLLSQHNHAFTAVHMCLHYLLNLTVKLLVFKLKGCTVTVLQNNYCSVTKQLAYVYINKYWMVNIWIVPHFYKLNFMYCIVYWNYKILIYLITVTIIKKSPVKLQDITENIIIISKTF